ncbi:uncharacterized protein K452DRAFT_329478 [Aplosporella prunicola CBS 121167]|uniref:Transcription factor domain-containing protein n=1 Tax=Aplosporella prunicola CBS 121167 TaxID=1176127 RepID=A0A6A6B2B3_9PEZI|nr:uncharacterized protein K452DRAFT_329478 [Aplosporella prunicola CBS 121167]KAF2136871.1 hypothetical protein K452DRAFT_329478 [Aplosporella prunicola CBS 121167]
MLFRYYIDQVSNFFDLCGPYRFFRSEVPHRARENSTLANAIFALSARLLHWREGLDSYVADRYYHACLQTLIPTLNDSQAFLDDSLLAATVLLRMLEEIDVHIFGSDAQGHLSGLQAIIRATTTTTTAARSPPPSGLRQAASWAAFRQELWMALQTQRPVAMRSRDLDAICGFERDHGFRPADDWVWAQRAVAQFGEALEWAFGAGGGGGGGGCGGGDGDSDGDADAGVEPAAGGEAAWRARLRENAAWRASVPRSYEPFFGGWGDDDDDDEDDGDGERDLGLVEEKPLPDVRFCADLYATAHNYNLFAHMILIVHDPTVPRLGPLRRAAVAAVDRRARNTVRKLVALALANFDASPAALLACMAVILCGDRFAPSPHQGQHDQHQRYRAEQHRFLALLTATEKRHGWPTARARAQLREGWGF